MMTDKETKQISFCKYCKGRRRIWIGYLRKEIECPFCLGKLEQAKEEEK
jgi:hypothetical protein